MIQNSDVKAERNRPVKQKAVQDGTLATGSLQRVQNMLVNMQGESAKMADDLVNAQQSCVIGPSVITNCTEAKTQFNAAVTELQTYKDNNKELDTATVLKEAIGLYCSEGFVPSTEAHPAARCDQTWELILHERATNN